MVQLKQKNMTEEVISNRQELIDQWNLNPIGTLEDFIDERLLLFVVELN